MSQAASDRKRRRIPEIDFWRGLALVVILVDHIPWNGLDYLTPQNFGFSDAAEAFVFLSGASVSLAYASTLQKAGFRRVVERCATRAGKLYLVQIAIVACSVAIPDGPLPSMPKLSGTVMVEVTWPAVVPTGAGIGFGRSPAL